MKCPLYISFVILLLIQGSRIDLLAQCESCKSYSEYQLNTEWGVSGSDAGELNSPRGIAIDNSGYLYVAERSAQRLQKFKADGSFIRVFGEKPETTVNSHMTVAVDDDANVYMTHDSGTYIYKFDSTGNYITRWDGQGILFGYYTAFNSIDGLLYVSDYFTDKVYKYQTDGTFEGTIGAQGSGDGEFNNPSGIGFDSEGNIYVADEENHRVQIFDADGNYINSWGTNGSSDGQFISPKGLVVDCTDNVHVIDGTGRLQKFKSDGTFVTSKTVFGQHLAINPLTGDIFISDLSSNKIKIYEQIADDYSGSNVDITNPNTTISADPSSIDANGRDTTNITIQLADSDGEHLTSSGGVVVINTTLGTLSAVTDNGDGTYSAILTSGTTSGKAKITATLNCEALTDELEVNLMESEFFPDDSSISGFMELWLDASDETTLFQDLAGTLPITDDGQSIQLWQDKSAKSNDATILTGKDPATFKSSEEETINGQPVVRFERPGLTDTEGTVFKTGVDVRTNTNEDLTIFTVYKPTSNINSGQGHAVWGNDNGAFDRFFYSYWKGSEFGGDGIDDGVVSLGGSTQALKIDDAGIIGQVYNLTTVYDGNGAANSSAIYFDGEILKTFIDNSDPTDALSNFYLGWDGDNSTFNGDIAEVIVYNRILNDCEIASLNFYLGNKYGKDFSNLKARFDYSDEFPDDINGIGILVNNCTNARRDYVEIGLAIIDNPSSNDVFNEFITFGHNNAGKGSSTEVPEGVGARLEQIWRVDEDGDLGTVNVSFDVSEFGVPKNAKATDFALLIDSDGDFSNATVENADISYNSKSGKVQIVGYDFDDGDYFTLGIISPLKVNITASEQVNEGVGLTVTISSNEAVTGDLVLSYNLTHITTNSSDFTGDTSGSVTIPSDSSSVTITINTNNDGLEENFESFEISITEVTNGLAIIENSADTVSIVAIPRSPLLATATSVSDSSFLASWDQPLTTEYYLLDVSTQSNFATLLPDYNNLKVYSADTIIYGLNPETQYFFRIRAVNAIGNSANSNVESVTTMSESPDAFKAINISTSAFTANWSTVSSALSYRLDLANDSLFTDFLIGFNDVTVNNTQYTINDQLLSGGTYYYRVRAVSSSGTSPNSNVVKVVTVPDPPLTLDLVQVDETTFEINWSESVGAENYLIDIAKDENFVNFVSGYQSKLISGISTEVVGLEGAQEYFIRVKASNESGNSSNSSTLNVITVPPIPTEIDTENFIANGFTITWQSLSGVEYYELDISTSSDFETYFGTYEAKRVDANIENVTGLNSGTNYFFRIRAIRGDRTSSYSEISSALTLADPPFILTLGNATSNSFEITWNSSISAESYLLEVSSDSTFSTLITGFDPLATSELEATVTELEPATYYYIRLKAENESGISGYLETSKIATTPEIPSEITATAQNSRKLQIEWLNTKGATSYLVDVSLTDDFSELDGAFTDMETTNTSLIVENLNSETTYYFRVQAKNNIVGTVSEESEVNQFTMPSSPIVDFVNAATDSFTVHLEKNANVVKYYYQISEDTFATLMPGTSIFSTEVDSFSITGLSDNKPYFYKVWAETDNGLTDTTEIIEQYTLAPLPELAFIERVMFALTTRIEWGYYTEENSPERLNNISFQIERADNDGLPFQSISEEIPMETDGGLQYDDFTDQEEMNARYRIKVINQGGFHYYLFEKSIITSIDEGILTPQQWVWTYPSLIKNNLYIDFDRSKVTSFEWKLYDTTGKIVLVGNEKVLDISFSDLPSGNYQLKMSSNIGTETFRLLKK